MRHRSRGCKKAAGTALQSEHCVKGIAASCRMLPPSCATQPLWLCRVPAGRQSYFTLAASCSMHPYTDICCLTQPLCLWGRHMVVLAHVACTLFI